VTIARRAATFVREWVVRALAGQDHANLPVLLSLPLTDNCNARCVMCDVWKTRSTGELTSEQLTSILRDPLFARVRHAGISGGEPSLRNDLPELVAAVVAGLPSLQTLSITTHGFHTRRWETFLPAIRLSCDSRRVALTLNVSIDGAGDVHDRVRGIPGAFEKAMSTHAVAQRLGVRVQWQCTISSANVHAAGRLLEHAEPHRVEVVFRKATSIPRLDNAVSAREVELQADEASFLADFLLSREVHAATRSLSRRLFYRDLAHRLVTGAPRRAPCHFQAEGVLLDAHGNLFQCSIADEPIGNALTTSAHALYFSPRADAMRRALVERVCPACLHDQSGRWAPLEVSAELARTHPMGRTALRALQAAELGAATIPVIARARWQLARGKRSADARLARLRSSTGLPRILLVGAYGGEHVGDAAILGGVLQRLHRDYGLTRAVVVSTRPDRTARWVRAIRAAATVEVLGASGPQIRDALRQVDAVCYAGGPLMDLPTVLVRHLETAVLATERGIPFLIEGVGIGPFRLLPSRHVASLLLALADGVRVRSVKDAAHPLLRGRKVEVDQDPAFDYLQTRSELNGITKVEQAQLDSLFENVRGKSVVGLNLRPFWQKYTGGTASSAAELESRFLAELAPALEELHSRYCGAIAFRFFPMNADRFGFSDLATAYALGKRLAPGLDYRVWESEPGVDAVLAFLRRVSVVVAMRFHAAIFALSQGLPTIGIDYQFGRLGKVANLFEEAGHREDLLRVDGFSATVLVDRLQVAIGASRTQDEAAP
jgi:polysaccharide pyruvyl transferase WcaK-like protein/MoaA/NifB/PqqE/SkfB family radical SAM enzyme